MTPVQREAVWQFSTWIVVACLILMAAAIALFAVIAWYRRSWLESAPSSSQAWTLEDLRRLRDQGSMTEEEFQAARSAMIAAYRAGGEAGEKADGSPEKRA